MNYFIAPIICFFWREERFTFPKKRVKLRSSYSIHKSRAALNLLLYTMYINKLLYIYDDIGMAVRAETLMLCTFRIAAVIKSKLIIINPVLSPKQF